MRSGAFRRSLCGIVAVVSLGGACSVSARTWKVYRDGSGDAATIQAAIDFSTGGDTILVGPGTYDQDSVVVEEKSLVLTSSEGPEFTEIPNLILVTGDGTQEVVISGFRILQSTSGLSAFFMTRLASAEVRDCIIVGFHIHSSIALVSRAVVEDCQFWHNHDTSDRSGGALIVQDVLEGEIHSCVFVENSTNGGVPGGEYLGGGGALAVLPDAFGGYTVTECVFIRNEAPSAGAVFMGSGRIVFSRNTLVGNRSGDGAAFIVGFNNSRVFGNVFAWNESFGLYEWPGDSSTWCWCNAHWENEGGGGMSSHEGEWWGDCLGWDDDLHDWDDVFADPQFCEADNYDYGLAASSPLLPENRPGDVEHCLGVIGAFDEGCAPIPPQPTQPTTWGQIKATYR